MRRKGIRLLSILFILFLFNCFFYGQAAVSKNQKSFLWKAQSKTGTVYLLGTIHFFKKELYPLKKTIEDAFDKADVLAVEANIEDVSNLSIQKLMEAAFYSGNDTLEKHVSGETYELVKKEFADSVLPSELINKQRPWLIALTLTSLKLVQLGFDPSYGIDIHFLSKAEGKKEIAELESVDYQIGLFSKFSDKEQEIYLLNTLKDLKMLAQEVNELIPAWKSGDVKTLEFILKKDEDEKTAFINERLIYERNRGMASKIEDFLKTAETYFVVVGAGHLVGDRGIIEILKGKGYSVEQQ
jgi:uncharacterized protein YbaP (TraB family)